MARSPAQATPGYVLSTLGRSIPVERGALLRIGRHPENDLVLADSSVSRFHARIEWPPPEQSPVVVDLGSANGTTLDGVRTHRASLGELARLTLGDVPLTVMLVHPSIIASIGITRFRLFDECTTDSSGDLRGAEDVRRLLLEMERCRRTVSFHLSDGGFEARVTFAGGRVVDARASGLVGLDALRLLLSRRGGGRYDITADVEPCERSGGPLPALRVVLGGV